MAKFLFYFFVVTLAGVCGDFTFDDDDGLMIDDDKEVMKPAAPIVKVADGVLQGDWHESTKGRPYAAFEGIPYGRPPTGKLKFSDPEPVVPWRGVWNATDPLIDCLQYDPFLQQVNGMEDCLHLNVYTPRLNSSGLPVLVYIHGGAFMYGSGAVYGPNHLLDKDMVIVTINYRLGALGFLSTGDETAPGNAGLKDQALALRWVRKNIKSFGGDPDNVTVGGVSAGAASVHYHYLSAMSRGTFARGMAFSGSAFAPWAHSVKPAEKARRLASILGCETSSSSLMMDCLNEISGEDIVEATIKMFDTKIELFTPFSPTIEPSESKNPFLTQSAYDATLAGGMFDAPLFVSVTADEGLYPGAVFQKNPEQLEELDGNWTEMASLLFQYNDSMSMDRGPSVAAKIKEHYFGKQPLGMETFPQLIQALSDRLFVAETGRLAQLHANSGHPVYMSCYSFRGEKSFSNVLTWTSTNYGAAHADDVLHIFKLPYLASKTPEDLKMTEALIDVIYSYVTTAVPKSTLNGSEWIPVVPGSSKLNYMEISSPTQFEMRTSSDFGQRSFWDSLGFIEYERQLQKGD